MLPFPGEIMGTYRHACLENAADQIKAGRNLQVMGKVPHLVYHMAVLALEEIGKSYLHGINKLAKARDPNEDEVALDDHTKKLFWAFWGAAMASGKISPQDMERLRGYASHLHKTRLDTLYVSDEIIPRDKVTDEDAEKVLNVAESRLSLELLYEPAEQTPEQVAMATWIHDRIEDLEERKFVLSKESLDKLAELGSVAPWIQWLQSIFAAIQKEADETYKKELTKEPDAGDPQKMKWQFSVQMESGSHEMRAKHLDKFSNASSWVKASWKSDHALSVTFQLAERFKINAVWNLGMAIVPQFLVALSIATRGFFWFKVHEDPDLLFPSIKNLEDGGILEAQRKGAPIKIQFQEGRRVTVLQKEDLDNAVRVYEGLFLLTEEKYRVAFGTYFTALGLYAKSDVSFNEVTRAFAGMVRAIHLLLIAMGVWDGKSGVFNVIAVTYETILAPNKEEVSRLITLGEAMLANPGLAMDASVSGGEFFALKRLFDDIARPFIEDKRKSVSAPGT